MGIKAYKFFRFGYVSNISCPSCIICVGKRSGGFKISSRYFSKMLSIPKYRAYRVPTHPYQKDNSPKPVNHCLTLKEIPRSKLTTSEVSQPMISYKLASYCTPVGSIIIELYALDFGCPHLTLKEELKVKSDHIRRFPAHDFL